MATQPAYICSVCKTPVADTSVMACANCGVDFTKVGPTPVGPALAPQPSRLGRGLLIGVVIAFVVVAVGLVALARLGNVTFYAGTYTRPAPGVILFGHGLDPTRQMIGSPTTTASEQDTIDLVAGFIRPSSGDIRIEVQEGNDRPQPLDAIHFATPATFFYATGFHVATLSGPGHYVFRIYAGSELLASGAIDVVSAPGSTPIPSGAQARTLELPVGSDNPARPADPPD